MVVHVPMSTMSKNLPPSPLVSKKFSNCFEFSVYQFSSVEFQMCKQRCAPKAIPLFEYPKVSFTFKRFNRATQNKSPNHGREENAAQTCRHVLFSIRKKKSRKNRHSILTESDRGHVLRACRSEGISGKRAKNEFLNGTTSDAIEDKPINKEVKWISCKKIHRKSIFI